MILSLSIILPCFNEEQNIIHLYNELNEIQFKNTDFFEIIFVQNGSTDNTESEINSVIKINKNNNLIIKMVKSSSNLGYGGGIKKGIENSNGEYIAWTHADLQTPLKDLYKLYNCMKDNKFSFGKGYRSNNRGYDGIVSRFHEKCASIILGENMKEINAQPKMFHKSLVKHFVKIPVNWTVIDTYVYYTVLRRKIEICEIDVIFKNRIHGFSKWKTNYRIFFKHLFFNFVYLFKLKFFD